MEFAGTATRELGVSSGSFDTKERVKQAVDIVDLVGSHIQLRRQGRNYVGLCPWHDDTKPQPASQSRAAVVQMLGVRHRRRTCSAS